MLLVHADLLTALNTPRNARPERNTRSEGYFRRWVSPGLMRRRARGKLSQGVKIRGKTAKIEMTSQNLPARKRIRDGRVVQWGRCSIHSSCFGSWKAVHILLTPALLAPGQRA